MRMAESAARSNTIVIPANSQTVCTPDEDRPCLTGHHKAMPAKRLASL